MGSPAGALVAGLLAARVLRSCSSANCQANVRLCSVFRGKLWMRFCGVSRSFVLRCGGLGVSCGLSLFALLRFSVWRPGRCGGAAVPSCAVWCRGRSGLFLAAGCLALCRCAGCCRRPLARRAPRRRSRRRGALRGVVPGLRSRAGVARAAGGAWPARWRVGSGRGGSSGAVGSLGGCCGCRLLWIPPLVAILGAARRRPRRVPACWRGCVRRLRRWR